MPIASCLLACALISLLFPWSQLNKKSRIGPFSYEQYSIGAAGAESICAPYNEEQIDELFDAPMKIVRGTAVLAHVFTGAASIGLLVLSCTFMDLFIIKIMGWLLVLGSIGIAMMFLMCASDLASEFSASLWWGTTLVVVASICALLAGLITLRLPESADRPKQEDRPATKVDRAPKHEQPKERTLPPGSETTTSEIMADGRTKYVTTKWNKNGSKTVTEIIE